MKEELRSLADRMGKEVVEVLREKVEGMKWFLGKVY